MTTFRTEGDSPSWEWPYVIVDSTRVYLVEVQVWPTLAADPKTVEKHKAKVESRESFFLFLRDVSHFT